MSFYAAAGLIGLVAFILLTNGEFFGAILLCLFGYGFYYWVNPRWKDELEDYVPEKSFRTFRLTEKQLKPIFIAIAVGAAILYVLLFITADAFIEKRGIIGFFIAGGLFGGTMFGCYAAYKALAVHGNVDHETNEFLSEALGVDVDEIIQVSTQTFDDTEEELENGAKLLVMTNRRIYFASFQEDHWIKCNEYLKDISSIGLKHTMTDEGFGINSFNGAIQMRLMFNDNTSLHIDLDVSNKTTTTPSLFVKTFLETIDNHLLGRLPEKKNRRRRVTTTTEGQPSAQPTVSQSIIKGISNAEQVSGRKLDL